MNSSLVVIDRSLLHRVVQHATTTELRVWLWLAVEAGEGDLSRSVSLPDLAERLQLEPLELYTALGRLNAADLLELGPSTQWQHVELRVRLRQAALLPAPEELPCRPYDTS